MGLPELNSVSKHFVPVILRFADKSDHILEFGSSSGHVSFYLAKMGYRISLLDIRGKPIETAQMAFDEAGIKANFYVEDFLSHNLKYDFLYNSGLIQCLDDNEKQLFIEHSLSISSKLLLFFPKRSALSVGNSMKGVAGCTEYPTGNIEPICKSIFNTVETGRITTDMTGFDFDFVWVFCDASVRNEQVIFNGRSAVNSGEKMFHYNA